MSQEEIRTASRSTTINFLQEHENRKQKNLFHMQHELCSPGLPQGSDTGNVLLLEFHPEVFGW